MILSYKHIIVNKICLRLIQKSKTFIQKEDFCYFCSKDKVRCGLINLVEIHSAEGNNE